MLSLYCVVVVLVLSYCCLYVVLLCWFCRNAVPLYLCYIDVVVLFLSLCWTCVYVAADYFLLMCCTCSTAVYLVVLRLHCFHFSAAPLLSYGCIFCFIAVPVLCCCCTVLFMFYCCTCVVLLLYCIVYVLLLYLCFSVDLQYCFWPIALSVLRCFSVDDLFLYTTVGWAILFFLFCIEPSPFWAG